MAITREHISDSLAAYLAAFPEEESRVALLLDATRGGGALTARSALPGHVTTGAFLLDDGGRVLQIAHKSLARWLNPGGHCEVEDIDLPGAALRELTEETGIPAASIQLIRAGSGRPFDVDVHAIPADGRKGEPAHWHYDFRYAFRLVGSATVALQEDEVDDHRWITIAELGDLVSAGAPATTDYGSDDSGGGRNCSSSDRIAAAKLAEIGQKALG